MTKTKRKKHTKKDGFAASLQAAAGRLNISLEVMSHCKALGWACFRSGGRVDCDGFLAQLAEHPEIVEKFEHAPSLRIEQALLVRARRERIAQQIAVERRELWHVDEIKRTAQRYIGAMKTALLNLSGNLSVAAGIDLKLTPEQQTRLSEMITHDTTAILTSFAKGEWLRTAFTCPKCAHQIEPAGEPHDEKNPDTAPA